MSNLAKAPGQLSYVAKDSFVHSLCGATKMAITLCLSIAAMITYHTFYLLFLMLASGMLFVLAKAKLSDFATVGIWILALMAINNIAIYMLAPEYGVGLYESRTELAHLFGKYYITAEQLFYQFNVTAKYLAILPASLVFFYATDPAEFAASLCQLGVHYKAAYAVSLALRYIPDIQRQFSEISKAQQARGVDLSKNAKLASRIKGAVSILLPLIVSSMDRIDAIADAMDLRGFGKLKRRTWYRQKPMRLADYSLIAASVLSIAVSVFLSIAAGSRFYNPFA
ncbi:MAG: energy-coupling factor transporter transmembrane protein EcfT [Eubacteriaceae bacterium]|nr:energy-coupling factor transporter transmembrane protein EcfT [Eubacteriaceae bacterium]